MTEEELEFAAAALWRSENPDMSVFACDSDMKDRYRERVRQENPDAYKEKCICQEQHRRGYCTESGCPYGNVRPARYVPEYQSIARVVDRLRAGPLAGDPVFEDAADLIEALAIKVGRDGLYVALVGSNGYYVPKPVMLEIEQRRQEVDALYRKSAKDVDNLRHWRNECGKLHAQLEKAKAMSGDGACCRCGAVPRNASGLCATCVDEDAVRAGEIDIEECGNHSAGSPPR